MNNLENLKEEAKVFQPCFVKLHCKMNKKEFSAHSTIQKGAVLSFWYGEFLKNVDMTVEISENLFLVVF